MARQRREFEDQLADIMTMARGSRTNGLSTPAMAPVGPNMIEDNAILNEHLTEGAVRLANLDTELTNTLADLAANETELKQAQIRLDQAEVRLDDAFDTLTILPSQLEQIEIDARAAATDMSKVIFQSSKPVPRSGSEKDLWIHTGDGNSPYRYDLAKRDWVKATDTAAIELAKTHANDLVSATKSQILTATEVAIEASRVATEAAAAADAKLQAESAEARVAATSATAAKKLADAAQDAAVAAAKTYADAQASGAGGVALEAAKADATAKADAAKSAAIAAAALDATAKKEQAEANAALDAKKKADAALAAAKVDATQKADSARADSLAAAEAAAASARAAAGLANSMGRTWFQAEAPPAGTAHSWAAAEFTSPSILTVDGVERARNLAIHPSPAIKGWSSRGSTGIATEATVATDDQGRSYRRITLTNTGTGAWWRHTGTISKEIVPGKMYRVAVTVRADKAGTPCSINYRWYASAGGWLPETGASLKVGTEWQTFEFAHRASDAAGRLDFDFGGTQASWSGVGAYVDLASVYLTDGEEVISYFDGSFPDDRENDLWIDTDDRNIPKRWNGTGWTEVTDKAAIEAAVTAAAADATAKATKALEDAKVHAVVQATAAQTAAIAAAAADARSQAESAEARAAVTAAADAKAKADAAQAAALAAAKTYADAEASGAGAAALAAAKADATAKANAAEVAAITAAATDATAKKEQAEANAALDAKAKADAALVAAKADAKLKADAALAAAKVDATTKADAAKAAAVTAAGIAAQATATAAAEAAEARAAVTAAADAKTKADAAQAAALAAAKTYTEAQASGAGTAALTAAKADATAKADAAKAAAIAAAALDATAKKESAEATAAADAKVKADAALAAAKIDATSKADAAKNAAILSAAADAQAKADKAQAAAVTLADAAAKVTATAAAEAAEARAATTAAADAKLKADAAQAAALAAAKTYTEAQASGAGTAALTAAKADATSKADAAKAAAIAAAALDATAKKEAAEATAAADAKTKADAALAAAKTDATSKANAAQSAAVAAAAVDATSKANAAQAAAVKAADTAAKVTATAAAEAAEARVAITAAADAKLKADAAQAAALAAAKTYADAEASGASAAALTAAKADATSKANAAQAAATTAAAADATAKKEQAESNAAADAKAKADAALVAAKVDATNKADAARDAAIEDAAKRAINLAPKGDFETGTVWEIFPTVSTVNGNKLLLATDTPRDGTRYLRYTHATTSEFSASMADVPVIPGRTYRVEVYARHNGVAPTGSIGWPCNWRNTAGGVLNNTWPALYSNAELGAKLTTAWQLFTADVTAPAGVTAMIPRVHAPANAGAAGMRIDFDVFTVRDVTDIVKTKTEAEAFTVEKMNNVANSKNATFYSTSAPSNTASPGTLAGDTWRRKDASGNIIGEWEWSGTGWTQRKMTSASMTAIDVGVLSAGSAVIADAVIKKIALGTAAIQQADIGNLTVTGTSNMNEVVAKRMAANVGTFIELNTSQLTASNAVIDNAVINELYSQVVESRLLKGEFIEANSISTRHLRVVGQNEIPDPYFVDAKINAERLAASSFAAGTASFVADDTSTSNVFRLTETSDTYRSLNISGASADARIPAKKGDVFKFRVLYRARGTAIAGANPPAVRFAIYHDSPKGAYIRYVGVGSYQTFTTSGANWYAHESEYKITQDDVGFIRPQLQMRNPGMSGELELKHPTVVSAATAGMLESDLVLASKVIAGDPQGIRAEMSPQGFKVYGKASGDATSTSTYEIVRLGVQDTNDMFAIADKDGITQAAISENGTISGKQIYAEEDIILKGDKLSDVLYELPRGHMGSAFRTTASQYNAKAGGELAPYLRLDLELERGRLYKISTSPMRYGQDADGEASIQLLQRTGAICTPQTGLVLCSVDIVGSDRESRSIMELAVPGGSGPDGEKVMVSYLLAYRSWKNQFGIRATNTNPVRLLVEDVGPLRETHTGVHLETTSTNGLAPTPPPAKVTSTSSWDCNWIRSFQGNGATYNYNTSKGYQGLSPAGIGNTKSVMLFPDMTSTLSGATVHSVKVYIHFEHWYYNAGGTARIGLYGSGFPTSYGGGSPVVTSSNWPKPGGRWVTIPASYYNGFKTGAYKGITLEGDSTYNTYGIAHPPKIQITYTK